MITVFRACAIKVLTLRESVVRPIITTVSGFTSLRILVEVRNMLACAVALSNESGSSAITGQPSSDANFWTLSCDKPARSWPITRRPRVDFV